MLRDDRARDRELRILRVLWCEIAALAVVLTGDVPFWLSAFVLTAIPVIGLAAEESSWLRSASV